MLIVLKYGNVLFIEFVLILRMDYEFMLFLVFC